MKIEIAEPGRMTQSGSSLLRLIQNNKTPILDLLVRESIQNCLDAQKASSKSVTVKLLTGLFNAKLLSSELEGITNALQQRFPYKEYQYLAIRDYDTVGLTGEIDVQKVTGNNYGNLLKLVYEIGKPQETEGAGGSWGLGKTVYFRIGIGLVIYYSRIDEGNGKYSSRLAASLVENESSPNAMIPEYKGMAKRGIAWWGDTIRENTTIPVVDEEYINSFLGLFGIKPYCNDETGTLVIIPYINCETLLANNRIDYADEIEEHHSPYWYSSIEAYLRIAVQRWFAPRLSNPYYPYGAFLKVYINETGLSVDSMEPVFKAVQALYNKANHVNSNDFIQQNKKDTIVESVSVRKLLTDSVAGNVACVKLSSDDLGMEAPENKPEPAVYLNCEIADKSFNRPLVFFVRQPGMIVSYETVSGWTAGIPCTNKNEYIFGIFVLNSPNGFIEQDSPVKKLEEYVRKSEMADHTSWNDWSFSHFNPRLITKIQKTVTRIISSHFVEENVESQPRESSELSRFLGDLVLPPDGYGKGANTTPNSNIKHKPKTPKKKKFSFAVITSGIEYYSGYMTVPMELKTTSNKRIKHTGFEVQIDSDYVKISLNEWENNLDLESPFSIENVSIRIDAFDENKEKVKLELNRGNPSTTFKDVCFSLRATSNGIVYGLDLTGETAHSFKIYFISRLRLQKKDVRPAFVFEKEDV